ncbi:hypothetical protein Adt_14394 [Abeliophyllum distichum]|uniref:Uncharacterized protein n=1 Tax=Abeliophyllum distichum TaxID=126358 RepID=A0ABD1TZI2_9LAMI
MAGFYFTKISVFKIRGGRVVDEKPRVVSMAPIPEPTIPPTVEVVGDVPSALSSTKVVPVLVEVVGDYSSLPSGSIAPVPAAFALPVVEVRDDSCSPSPVVDVGSGSSSSSPVMEACTNPQSLPSGSVVNLSTSIPSQDEGEEDV